MSEAEFENPDDPRMIAEYRSFSFISACAALLGLFSLLASINFQMIAVPFITVIVALIAIFRVEFAEKRPTGGFFAYAGLFLATAVAAGAISYRQMHQQRLFQFADKFARQWFELVQKGEIYRPFELTMSLGERQKNDVDLNKHYKEMPITDRVLFSSYKMLQPELTVRKAGKNCELVLLGPEKASRPQLKTDVFCLLYEIKWDDPEKKAWLVRAVVKREEGLPPLGPQWTFSSLECVDPKYERKLVGVTTQ